MHPVDDEHPGGFPVPPEACHLLLSDPLSVPEWAEYFRSGEKTTRGMLRRYEQEGRAERYGRAKWRIRLTAWPIGYLKEVAKGATAGQDR
jgi:hypothetical protein